MVFGSQLPSGSARTLLWVLGLPSTCPTCARRLHHTVRRIRLDLPRASFEVEMQLYTCAHCENRQYLANLDEIEQTLLEAKYLQTGGGVAAVFELESFTLDGVWLEVYVQVSDHRLTIPWSVYTLGLEAEQELLEAQAIRSRFGTNDET
jgi:hypothetical protein